MSKFGAIKVKADGYVFDSKAEFDRYQDLKWLERGGQIRGLRVHTRHPIVVNGVHVCDVEDDFSYFERDQKIHEDVKGFDTDISRLKRKLVQAAYPGIVWVIIKTEKKGGKNVRGFMGRGSGPRRTRIGS